MAVCFIAAACMFAAVPAAAGEETKIGYRFADASEAAEMRDCTVVFTTKEPFRQEGDNFFDDNGVTGLVPVDDLNTMYIADDAANFWDVFGRNTEYVIDPEETLADNFSYAVIYGTDSEKYKNPEIVRNIDALLRNAQQ